MTGAGTTRRAFLRTSGIIAAGMTMNPIVQAFDAARDFNVEETTIVVLQAATRWRNAAPWGGTASTPR